MILYCQLRRYLIVQFVVSIPQCFQRRVYVCIFNSKYIYAMFWYMCVRACVMEVVHVLRMCAVCAIMYINMFIHCYACYFTCFYYYPRVCPYFPIVMCVIVCDVSYFVTIICNSNEICIVMRVISCTAMST